MNINDLIKDNDSLATLPEVYYKLNKAILDPDCTFDDIGDIISLDPSITTRLLRIVNSAYFGFSNRVETVTHALAVIGTDQLSQLILATEVMSRFKGIPEEIYNIESFWRHSLVCGLAARSLAGFCNEANIERYFVAGLLHDVGRLVMFSKVPKEMREVMQRSRELGSPLFKEEKKFFGFDHAEVGRLLIKSWLLPERLEESIGYHHAPEDAINYPIEAAVTCLANGIAHSVQLGDSAEVIVVPLNQRCWETLGLPESLYLHLVKDKIAAQYEDVTQTFLVKS